MDATCTDPPLSCRLTPEEQVSIEKVLGALLENLTLREILAKFEDDRIRRDIFSLVNFIDVAIHAFLEIGSQFVSDS